MTDFALGKRILALRDRVVAEFTVSDWHEAGLLTGFSDAVSRHKRLLRSLSFGDEDYSGSALEMLKQIADKDEQAFLTFESFVAEKSARMLPRLSVAVPMKAKLRQLPPNLGGGNLRELNPNPFANDLGHAVSVGQLHNQLIQNFRSRKCPVPLPLFAVNRQPPVFRVQLLVGSVLEALRLIWMLGFHGLFFRVLLFVFGLSAFTNQARANRAARGRRLQRAPRSGPRLKRASEGDRTTNRQNQNDLKTLPDTLG